jgi:DNA-binding NtrC family response regulator
MAVRATKLGAIDFLEKPLSTDKLLLTGRECAEAAAAGRRESRAAGARGSPRNRVEERRDAARDVAGGAGGVGRIAGVHPGRDGSGKELIARAIHEGSARREKPFITLNCAAVPGELIESELFGHEKGSFTGAASRHNGKVRTGESRDVVPG